MQTFFSKNLPQRYNIFSKQAKISVLFPHSHPNIQAQRHYPSSLDNALVIDEVDSMGKVSILAHIDKRLGLPKWEK